MVTSTDAASSGWYDCSDRWLFEWRWQQRFDTGTDRDADIGTNCDADIGTNCDGNLGVDCDGNLGVDCDADRSAGGRHDDRRRS